MNKNNDNEPLENSEERILKAAEREFLEKGYAGARTTTIAEAAGVTHAMLHYYFRTKEKLFQKILADKVSLLKGMMLTPLLDEDVPLIDKVRHAIETHLDFIAANPELPRFMINVMSGYPEFAGFFKERVHEDPNNIIAIFQREIDRNADLGICKRLDARMLVLDIISLNVFSFVGAPLLENVIGGFINDDDFLESRKKNNVEMILQKLMP